MLTDYALKSIQQVGNFFRHLLRGMLIDLHGHLNVFMRKTVPHIFGAAPFSARIIA